MSKLRQINESIVRFCAEEVQLRDGNGRVGKIIYNWLCAMLHDPMLPPRFWGHERSGSDGR